MPTESDDRDVNEGDDTEETGGSSKKQNVRPALAGGSLPSFLGNGLVVSN